MGDPWFLFLEGLDPRGLTPQGLVDRQRGELPLRPLAHLRKPIEAFRVPLDPPVDRVQTLDGLFRHHFRRPEGRQLLVQRSALHPALAERKGQIHCTDRVFISVGVLLQPRDFQVQLIPLGRQMSPTPVDRPKLLDLCV